MSSVNIRLVRELFDDSKEWANKCANLPKSGASVKLVTPGDAIRDDSSFMRGHGTYLEGDSQLVASVAGVVEPINRLISVRPLRTRYNGEIGDVVIGRITEVQQKRWKVDTNARLDSVLQLSGVNLPGGELRRKTSEDEMMMRSYLKEGDIISAEVQNVFEDGALGLHTRSLKYGKLGQGVLIRVSPSLIERRKTHFHNLPVGAHIIFGNNGFVWISRTVADGAESGGFMLDFNEVPLQERQTIARLRNCALALAHQKVMLHDTSILYAFDISFQLGYQVCDLLMPEVINVVVSQTKQRLLQSEDMS